MSPEQVEQLFRAQAAEILALRGELAQLRQHLDRQVLALARAADDELAAVRGAVAALTQELCTLPDALTCDRRDPDILED